MSRRGQPTGNHAWAPASERASSDEGAGGGLRQGSMEFLRYLATCNEQTPAGLTKDDKEAWKNWHKTRVDNTARSAFNADIEPRQICRHLIEVPAWWGGQMEARCCVEHAYMRVDVECWTTLSSAFRIMTVMPCLQFKANSKSSYLAPVNVMNEILKRAKDSQDER